LYNAVDNDERQEDDSKHPIFGEYGDDDERQHDNQPEKIDQENVRYVFICSDKFIHLLDECA
jgi:hypothetical protein